MNNEEKKTNGTDNQQPEKPVKIKKKVNVKKVAKTVGKVAVSVLLIGGGILIGKGGSSKAGSDNDDVTDSDSTGDTSED